MLSVTFKNHNRFFLCFSVAKNSLTTEKPLFGSNFLLILQPKKRKSVLISVLAFRCINDRILKFFEIDDVRTRLTTRLTTWHILKPDPDHSKINRFDPVFQLIFTKLICNRYYMNRSSLRRIIFSFGMIRNLIYLLIGVYQIRSTSKSLFWGWVMTRPDYDIRDSCQTIGRNYALETIWLNLDIPLWYHINMFIILTRFFWVHIKWTQN